MNLYKIQTHQGLLQGLKYTLIIQSLICIQYITYITYLRFYKTLFKINILQ